MTSRTATVLCVFLGALAVGWLARRSHASRQQLAEAPAPTINKQPMTLSTLTFDPAAPPSTMPPLAPGENAECDSEFRSSANVHGDPQQTDATHATITVTQVNMTLQLIVNIWLPAGAAHRVTDHEDGHRQISEYYYRTAAELAGRIAAKYLGKRIEITGADLPAESSKALQKLATDITDEYGRELNPEPAQLLYDSITDHGRNDVVVKNAVDHALKNAAIESTPSPANPRD